MDDDLQEKSIATILLLFLVGLLVGGFIGFKIGFML